MKHIISILIENEAGALSRVIGLFSARDFNIESLNVAPTEEKSISRITLVTNGSDKIVEQITKQLNKLIDVIKLIELTDSSYVGRELMIVKIKIDNKDKIDIMNIVQSFRGHIVDISKDNLIVEVTGSSRKLDALLELIDKAKLAEVIRTGICGLSRGSKVLTL